jgi:hypothetical protein
MADLDDTIKNILYIISVAILFGILVFVILGDINISGDISAWKTQVLGSTIGATITVIGALVAIHYKSWWDNRIDINVKIREYSEEDEYGDISGYLVASARNKSLRRVVTIDSFRLKLYQDGKERYLDTNWKADERNKSISFPYDLLPGKKLSIILEGSDEFRKYFFDHETGEYNFPVMGCLIAYFEDQSEKLHQSTPFRIC